MVRKKNLNVRTPAYAAVYDNYGQGKQQDLGKKKIVFLVPRRPRLIEVLTIVGH